MRLAEWVRETIFSIMFYHFSSGKQKKITYIVGTLVYTCVICVPLPGEGYDKRLKELLDAEILPMAKEFDKKLNDGMNTCSDKHTQLHK